MKRSLGKFLLLGFLALGGFSGVSHAEVKLHPLFTDNMVLQRDKPLVVWGSAAPAEKVTVQIGSQSKGATAGADGAWKVTLDALPASRQTAFEVQGENKISLQNVAIGDVWVCSGQSNMAWLVKNSNNAAAEVAAANYPQIRLLTIPQKIAATPQTGFAAVVQWKTATPQTVPDFSAVSYFFGREIQQALDVPIGLINSSRGGTIAEAWTSREALTALGEPYTAQLKAMDALAQARARTPFAEAVSQWWQNNDIGTREKWQSPGVETADWKNIVLPGAIERVELNFDGIMWFRREVEIPEAWAGQDVVLRLGVVDEIDDAYFNGVRIGGGMNGRLKREYTIPASQVKAGRAVVAVRIFDRAGAGGILGDPNYSPWDLRLLLKAQPNTVLVLNGNWQYRVTAQRKDIPPYPINWATTPNQTSVLFNGMIAPLTSFPVRGVVWYQGEANTPRPEAYRTLFPALIRDWRTQWGAKQDGSEFGFFFVQLANYMSRSADPAQSGWAELRGAQTQTLSVPRTGMASAIDIGEEKDIHPRNKQDVGKRLALAALAVEYGQELEYSGPMYKGMKIEGSKVRIEFTHAKGLKQGEPTTVDLHKPSASESLVEPIDHWTYAQYDKLVQAGVFESRFPSGMWNGPPDRWSLTRYQFAVALARYLQAEEDGLSKPIPWTVELKNALFVLMREFEPELKALTIDTSLAPKVGGFINGFAVRGAEGPWAWAKAQIDGETVLVWNEDVPKPVAVRYGWQNNPNVNLINGVGLPAVPFRTDGP